MSTDLAASVNTLMAAAVTAFADGDYATALSKCETALIAREGIPDFRTAGGLSVQWRDAAAIERVIERIEKKIRASQTGGRVRTVGFRDFR